MKDLFDILKSPKHIKITPKNFPNILEDIKSNKVTSLDLSYNDIDDNGAKLIADALKINTSLDWLILSNNKIRDKGAIAIADALKIHEFLTKLDVSCNDIRENGAKAIAAALKINKSLVSLNIWDDDAKIGYWGGMALADALKINTSITTLILNDCSIDDRIDMQIESLLLENKKFQKKQKLIPSFQNEQQTKNFNVHFFFQSYPNNETKIEIENSKATLETAQTNEFKK